MNDRDEVDRNTAAVHRRDVGRIIRMIVVVALVAVLVVVALDNRNKARVGYAIGDADIPVWFLIVAAAVGGMIIGWLVRHRPRNHA